MEIFIVGGIVVVIMIVVSTKIKKSAARAFEREIVETTDFRIIKPEGLMHPIREDSEYEFEAYSKDFGDQGARNVWQAQAYLSVLTNSSFAAVCEAAKQKAVVVLSEKISEAEISGEKICLLESEMIEEEVEFYEYRKIIESRRAPKIYDLRILILQSHQNEYASKVEELTDSFHLK